MMVDWWQALVPEDVRKNLERYGSAVAMLALIEAAPALGKIPYCHDATASYWAREILGRADGRVYPLETRDEYGTRHLATCQDEACAWCAEERLFL